MKNRMQLYSKHMVPVVIVAMMLCFVSAVWAAQQQQQPIEESKPVVTTNTTNTDVWINSFHVRNKSRDCYITNSGCDIYELDELMIYGDVAICGCVNRPVWVKFEVDAALLKEDLMTMFQHYPSEPVCYHPTVCPVVTSFSRGATWIVGPGTHTLKMSVDSKNEIYEINEHNNSKSITVTGKLIPLQLPKTKPKTPIKIPVPNAPASGQLR